MRSLAEIIPIIISTTKVFIITVEYNLLYKVTCYISGIHNIVFFAVTAGLTPCIRIGDMRFAVTIYRDVRLGARAIIIGLNQYFPAPNSSTTGSVANFSGCRIGYMRISCIVYNDSSFGTYSDQALTRPVAA